MYKKNIEQNYDFKKRMKGVRLFLKKFEKILNENKVYPYTKVYNILFFVGPFAKYFFCVSSYSRADY